MNKNEREKQMLYEWGMKNCAEDFFGQIDKTKESYFLKKPDSSYVREYAFETFPEVMEELNMLWENDGTMEQIKKVIGVAAMKSKPVRRDEEKERVKEQTDQGEKLPVFIYNF